MDSFLTSMTTFFASALNWMSSLITSITGNPPLLVLTFGFATVGFVVGLLRRIIRLG